MLAQARAAADEQDPGAPGERVTPRRYSAPDRAGRPAV